MQVMLQTQQIQWNGVQRLKQIEDYRMRGLQSSFESLEGINLSK